MLASLKDSRLKLKRARDDLATLQDHVREFLEAEPYMVVLEMEKDRTEHVYYVYVRRNPPAYLGAIIGDVLHNLRSALDAIVWELSEKKDTLKDRELKSIQFPICEDGTKYDESPARYASKAVRAEIKAAQPYHSPVPSTHPLALINRNNLLDKHRTVPVITTLIEGQSSSFAPPGIAYKQDTAHVGPFEDGAEIARFVFTEPQPMVDMKFKPFFDVAFEYPGNPAVDDLRFCIDYVERSVLPRFAPFCEPGALRRPLFD